MVSLRRRRLLGLCSGGAQNSIVDTSSATLFENNVNAVENDDISSNPASVHPMLLDDLNLPPKDVGDPFERCDSPNVSNRNQPEDQNNQSNVCVSSSSKETTTEDVLKRRKKNRRKNKDNNVAMRLRGVYLKNLKWQAAIKVDKIQIHLGTLSSQEEAVHLYDRAAFMCGREPNFELPQEEKQELRKVKWDEFLAMTRRDISSKRTRRSHVRKPTVHTVPPTTKGTKQLRPSLLLMTHKSRTSDVITSLPLSKRKIGH